MERLHIFDVDDAVVTPTISERSGVHTVDMETQLKPEVIIGIKNKENFNFLILQA